MTRSNLSRRRNHQRSLVRNLATSFILYERLQTTPAKAHLAIQAVDRLVTVAKEWRDTTDAGRRLALFRRLIAATTDQLAVRKLTEVLAQRYTNRVSGFARRWRLAPRLGDHAEQVLLKLIAEPVTSEPGPARSTGRAARTAPRRLKDA